jgi:hypothetical protein
MNATERAIAAAKSVARGWAHAHPGEPINPDWACRAWQATAVMLALGGTGAPRYWEIWEVFHVTLHSAVRVRRCA